MISASILTEQHLLTAAACALQGRAFESVPWSPSLGEFAAAARLLPACHVHDDLFAEAPVEFVAQARKAYVARCLVAETQRHCALEMGEALDKADIPWVAFRGVFAATRWYADPAVRPGNDLDLLVSRRNALRALNTLARLGWELVDPRMPKGFFLRHHLHWQLRHARTRLLCDLHWAVTSPLEGNRFDVEALLAHRTTAHGPNQFSFTTPSPEHALLVECLHLLKHEPRVLDIIHAANPCALLLGKGLFFHLHDAHSLVVNESPDWHRLETLAHLWHLDFALLSMLEIITRFWGTPVPDTLLERLRGVVSSHAPPPKKNAIRRHSSPRFLRTLALRGGFAPRRFHDLFAPMLATRASLAGKPGWQAAVERTLLAPRYTCRLIYLGFDSLVCHALASLKKSPKPSPIPPPHNVSSHVSG